MVFPIQSKKKIKENNDTENGIQKSSEESIKPIVLIAM